MFARSTQPLFEQHYSPDEPFNPQFTVPERLLDVRDEVVHGRVVRQYLVKWMGQGYDEVTWEERSAFDGTVVCEGLTGPPLMTGADATDLIHEFEMRQIQPTRTAAKAKTPWVAYDKSPVFLNGNQLRSYQLEGLNWLAYCWHNGHGSILADEMGLGKTVQSVSLLNYLWQTQGIAGPFLVVAPLSTLPHWQREFARWTNMNAIVYHGNQAARDVLHKYEFFYKVRTTNAGLDACWPRGGAVGSADGSADLSHNGHTNAASASNLPSQGANGKPLPGHWKFHVLIATYEMVMQGMAHLRPVMWRAAILDEAHRLKSRNSKVRSRPHGICVLRRRLG